MVVKIKILPLFCRKKQSFFFVIPKKFKSILNIHIQNEFFRDSLVLRCGRMRGKSFQLPQMKVRL